MAATDGQAKGKTMSRGETIKGVHVHEQRVPCAEEIAQPYTAIVTASTVCEKHYFGLPLPGTTWKPDGKASFAPSTSTGLIASHV